MLAGFAPVTHAQDGITAAITRAAALGSEHPDSAFLLLRGLYTTSLEQQKTMAAATALQQIGQLCYRQGHYAQAMEFHFQASALFKKSGDAEAYAANLNDIGNLYYYNKQTALARQQFDQAANRFQVFRREGKPGAPYSHDLLKVVNVSALQSDGSETVARPMGSAFPKGLFVAMSNDRTFHFYRWEDIAGKKLSSIH